MRHALNENRNGLTVGVRATEASGTAERTATSEMIDALESKHGKKPKTLGADKGTTAAGSSRSWRSARSSRTCRW